jgi:beta-xylosidase
MATAAGPQVLDFPDPSVLYVQAPPPEGVDAPEEPPPPTYFAYATGSGYSTLQVASSTDLVHWTWEADPFAGPETDLATAGGSGWADLFAHTWAPSVVEVRTNPPQSRFVMYYASRSKVPGSAGLQCIGRATSARPLGPFVDSSTTPFVCAVDRGGSIDPEPFVDRNGQRWLLWKSEGSAAAGEPTRLWSSPMSSDGLTITGAASELLETQTSWEMPIVEAPSMMPAPDSGYLLFYSASSWQTADYKTAVAWCATPASACSRIYSSPVLATRDSMAGAGGGSVFQSAQGAWWLAFDAWTSPYVGYQAPPDGRYARSLRLLPITFPAGGHQPAVG